MRELIPEFFYLPDFLTNKNKFDFGSTQKGDDVCDVQLPVWANNDPIEFIKRNREALESQFVSENLHNWIDLIFGWKQRGIAAEESMNVYIHLTYDGEVDVDAISDPILRDATIAQINNFGQTPTKLFDKPHPKKTVNQFIFIFLHIVFDSFSQSNISWQYLTADFIYRACYSQFFCSIVYLNKFSVINISEK